MVVFTSFYNSVATFSNGGVQFVLDLCHFLFLLPKYFVFERLSSDKIILNLRLHLSLSLSLLFYWEENYISFFAILVYESLVLL